MRMESNGKSDVKTDDLICPITLRIFSDPVVAADGRTYERAAIVRWIAEHGTSPFTRQPLKITELQADDYLRKLAAERRSSIVSYNYDENRDHTSLQRQSSTISYNYNINIDRALFMQLQTIPNNNITLIDNTEDHYVSRHHCWQRNRSLIIILMFMVASTFCFCLIWSVFHQSSKSSITHNLFLFTHCIYPSILILGFLRLHKMS
jgi:hypothetical protein